MNMNHLVTISGPDKQFFIKGRKMRNCKSHIFKKLVVFGNFYRFLVTTLPTHALMNDG